VVAQNALQHPGGGVIGAVIAGQAERDDHQAIRPVGFKLHRFGSHRLQVYLRPGGQGFAGYGAEQPLDLGQGLVGVHVAGDDDNGIVGDVPGVVKLLQHGAGGLVEGWLGAQGVMGIGRPLEHGCQELAVKDVLGIGQIPGDFLLDGTPFLLPELFGVHDATHAHGLDMEGHLQVVSRHRKKILGNGLLGIGVEAAAHGGRDVGQLIGGKPGAAAEHHMFLGVGHAGKPRRRLVGARQIVDHDRSHGGQAVGHDDHLEAVVQGGPQDRGLVALLGTGRQGRQHEQEDDGPPESLSDAAFREGWLAHGYLQLGSSEE
jgi:hypothetical protein